MKPSHRIENQICIVSIEGNIALDGTNDVKEYVQPFINDNEIKGLIINFAKVNFIDSSGIGLMVSIFKSLQQRQAKFALIELSQKNKEIFSMTRLDKILTICEGEPDALELISE